MLPAGGGILGKCKSKKEEDVALALSKLLAIDGLSKASVNTKLEMCRLQILEIRENIRREDKDDDGDADNCANCDDDDDGADIEEDAHDAGETVDDTII